MMLSETQVKNLEVAVDRAEGMGMCCYVYRNGQPCCVIAQLAALEEPERFNTVFFGLTLVSIGQLLQKEQFRTAMPKLLEYPDYLLERIQRIWDGGVEETSARQRMRDLVKSVVDGTHPVVEVV